MVSETKRVLVTGGGRVHRLTPGPPGCCLPATTCWWSTPSAQAHGPTSQRWSVIHGCRCAAIDVIDPLYVEVDQIYNLACPASPVPTRNPIKTIKTSTVGTNVLGLAKRPGAPIFCVDLGGLRRPAGPSPGPKNTGGTSTRSGRRSVTTRASGRRVVVHQLPPAHGVDVKVARIFNTYGPGMGPGRRPGGFQLHRSGVAGKPLTVYGDGRQTRSFCYVDDLRRWARPADGHRHDITGPINIGNPLEVTMLELAKMVSDIAGGSGHIEHRPLPPDDPKRHRRPSSRLTTFSGGARRRRSLTAWPVRSTTFAAWKGARDGRGDGGHPDPQPARAAGTDSALGPRPMRRRHRGRRGGRRRLGRHGEGPRTTWTTPV